MNGREKEEKREKQHFSNKEKNFSSRRERMLASKDSQFSCLSEWKEKKEKKKTRFLSLVILEWWMRRGKWIVGDVNEEKKRKPDWEKEVGAIVEKTTPKEKRVFIWFSRFPTVGNNVSNPLPSPSISRLHLLGQCNYRLWSRIQCCRLYPRAFQWMGCENWWRYW